MPSISKVICVTKKLNQCHLYQSFFGGAIFNATPENLVCRLVKMSFFFKFCFLNFKQHPQDVTSFQIDQICWLFLLGSCFFLRQIISRIRIREAFILFAVLNEWCSCDCAYIFNAFFCSSTIHGFNEFFKFCLDLWLSSSISLKCNIL